MPKTGGNSIQGYLTNYSQDKIVLKNKLHDGVETFEVSNTNYMLSKHATLSKYKKYLGGSFYSYFKFGVIRNPWDMMISMYFSPHSGRSEWNRNEFINLLMKTRSLSYYFYPNDILNRIMLRYRIHKKNALSFLDYVIRFENLQDDFNNVCDLLSIPRTQLSIRNKSTRQHYSKYYDEELVSLVSMHFHQAIELGSYHFENV